MPIRVFAVPGRLYPHPDGHRRSAARFLGRFAAVPDPDREMDPRKPQKTDVRAPDVRFPINPEGGLVGDEYASDITRAVQHGDLSLTAPTAQQPEPEKVAEIPVEAPRAEPTVIHTDANIAGGQSIRRLTET